MKKKLISILLVLAMAVCAFPMSAFAEAPSDNTETLSIAFDGDYTINTVYPATEYYIEKSETDNWYVADVCDLNGNVVETFSMKKEEMPLTRGVGTIQRTFRDTKYQEVLWGVKVCGITNEVVLVIYVYNSFKQIESVASNRVYAADGFTGFTLNGTTCNALPLNGYPAQYVNCFYSGSCSITVINGTVSGNAGISGGDLVDVGFSIGMSSGVSVYYNKTLSNTWSISV